jgi:hypothetical protein
MHQRTSEDEKEWKPSQQMRPVFGQKEEAAHERDDEQTDSSG